jgi:hypothetical protein
MDGDPVQFCKNSASRIKIDPLLILLPIRCNAPRMTWNRGTASVPAIDWAGKVIIKLSKQFAACGLSALTIGNQPNYLSTQGCTRLIIRHNWSKFNINLVGFRPAETNSINTGRFNR